MNNVVVLRPNAAPSIVRRVNVRLASDDAEHQTDWVAEESPVAIVVNGISHAVMMASPSDLKVFGLGFAMSEGILQSPSECYDISVIEHPEGKEVCLTIAATQFARLKIKRRSLAGATGCGLCGVESLGLIELYPGRIPRPEWFDYFSHDALQYAVKSLPLHQPANGDVGSLHAAAWCAPDGVINFAIEDVGRHNALDKLIGTLAKTRAPLDEGFVLLTSRLSYELVSKCARVGIFMVAGISGPSALAIEIAERSGVVLFGYCRSARATQFTF